MIVSALKALPADEGEVGAEGAGDGAAGEEGDDVFGGGPAQYVNAVVDGSERRIRALCHDRIVVSRHSQRCGDGKPQPARGGENGGGDGVVGAQHAVRPVLPVEGGESRRGAVEVAGHAGRQGAAGGAESRQFLPAAVRVHVGEIQQRGAPFGQHGLRARAHRRRVVAVGRIDVVARNVGIDDKARRVPRRLANDGAVSVHEDRTDKDDRLGAFAEQRRHGGFLFRRRFARAA